jgi:hypothetical protein
MKAMNFLFVLLLLICGCSSGEYKRFEQTVSQLKPGMNKGEVKQLFASFKLITETNVVYTLDSETKWFATNNNKCASLVLYGNHIFMSLQDCAIFFNTNDIIIAQYYIPDGHHMPPGLPPPK